MSYDEEREMLIKKYSKCSHGELMRLLLLEKGFHWGANKPWEKEE